MPFAFWKKSRPGVRTGTAEYERHLAEERAHYTEMYAGERGDRERLMETSAPAWDEVLARSAERIRARTGADMEGNILSCLRASPESRMLSLGCGPGGIELALARELPKARILGLDVNEDLLAMGRAAALAEGLAVEFAAADLNKPVLGEMQYDVVFCHASLHHLIELEALFAQIRQALRPRGRLIVMDIITPSGYQMRPETRKLAQAIFATLPERLRVNHRAYAKPRADVELWAQDTRDAGMECIRSGDIVPLLRANFREVHYVALHALARRFFDLMYGPNYDLARPLDQAIFNWIWELDCDALDSGRLEPESFFGVYEA